MLWLSFLSAVAATGSPFCDYEKRGWNIKTSEMHKNIKQWITSKEFFPFHKRNRLFWQMATFKTTKYREVSGSTRDVLVQCWGVNIVDLISYSGILFLHYHNNVNELGWNRYSKVSGLVHYGAIHPLLNPKGLNRHIFKAKPLYFCSIFETYNVTAVADIQRGTMGWFCPLSSSAWVFLTCNIMSQAACVQVGWQHLLFETTTDTCFIILDRPRHCVSWLSDTLEIFIMTSLFCIVLCHFSEISLVCLSYTPWSRFDGFDIADRV